MFDICLPGTHGKARQGIQIDGLPAIIDHYQVFQGLQFSSCGQGQLQAVTHAFVQGLQLIDQQSIHRDAQRSHQLLHGQATGRQQGVIDLQFNHILARVGTRPTIGNPRMFT